MSTTQDAAVKVEAVAPSQAVIERVAGCEGVHHTELVRLFDAIDPDALDNLVERSQGKASALQITFTYNGYDVTVTGDGVVHLARDADIDG
jgi:hypothetical protein